MKKKYFKLPLIIIIGIRLTYFLISSYSYSATWKDSNTLWTYVIKFDPEYSIAYKSRAYWNATEKNNYQKALEDYNKSIILNPLDVSTLIGRGNVYGIIGKFDLAIADFSYAIKIDSLSMDAYRNRAITFINIKQYAKALPDINKAICISPQNIELIGIRGYVYLQLNNYNECIKNYNLVILNNPSEAKSYFYEGIAYFNLKNFKRASDLFTKTIELKKDYPDAEHYRSETLNELNHLKVK